jgi:hypothetical protein
MGAAADMQILAQLKKAQGETNARLDEQSALLKTIIEQLQYSNQLAYERSHREGG